MDRFNRSSFNNIALFADMENLIISSLEIGLPVNLEPVIRKLLESGRVTIRRGFGDLDAACRGEWKIRSQVRRMMLDNLVQFEDIPYSTPHKNTADMRLTVEALSTAYNYPDVNYFAIVASDRDYVPLISKLRELGRCIIGVGCSPDTVNEIYVKSCDLFIYYSTLFSSAPVQTQNGVAQNPHDSVLLDSYMSLLCNAVRSLDQRGLKSVGAAVAPLMRQLRSDFDPSLVGFRGLRQLVEEAERRGLCEIQPHGEDMFIRLTAEAARVREEEMSASYSQFSPRHFVPSIEDYRKYFLEKLRCEIPSAKLRAFIYREGVRLIEEQVRDILDLSELSIEISRILVQKGGPAAQPVIFKVLYALFRAKAFKFELSEQPYNPEITGIITPPEHWDELFIRNCLTVLKWDRRSWSINLPAIADLFEIEEEKIDEIMKTLDSRNPDA